MKRRIRRMFVAVLAAAMAVSIAMPAALADEAPAAVTPGEAFRTTLLNTVKTVEDKGGYYTGRQKIDAFPQTAWQGMNAAFAMEQGRPAIDLSKARPSFCSSAVYLTVLKALADWDTGNAVSEAAWMNLKPYVLDGGAYPFQKDGVGCWGRANANGPGFAVLVGQMGAGESFYIGGPGEYVTDEEYWQQWEKVQGGDILKLFWNDDIGYNAAQSDRGEKGHLVIFLSRETSYLEDGTRDDLITYWSSNGSGVMPDGGYGTSQIRASSVVRAVDTRITNPAAFNNARLIPPTSVSPWLSALENKRLATLDELMAALAGEPMGHWLEERP